MVIIIIISILVVLIINIIIFHQLTHEIDTQSPVLNVIVSL